jgi:SPP1 gp7 family putative phage head morphogenesis protein
MADGGKKIPIDVQTLGLLAQAALHNQQNVGVFGRVKNAVRYLLSGKIDSIWMSPGQPILPQAQEIEGRNWDFPVGYNYQLKPRTGEPLDFWMLRALAQQDLVRLAIETRKDQLEKLPWKIVARDSAKAKKNDARVEKINNFFKFPDKQHTWNRWLRILVEDMLVIDAATVYPRLTAGGELWSLEIYDGATIKPLIDETGRRPLAPDPAYQQYIKGIPAADYTADELLYLPRNERSWKVYGFSPVEQIVTTVNIAIRRQLMQLDFYTEGNIPDAFITCPPEWNAETVNKFQTMWDELFFGDTAQMRKAKFIPGGQSITFTKRDALKDEFDEWLARIVCYAFSLPPTAFVKQMNRATADTAQDAAVEEGLEPLMMWVKDTIDLILIKYFDADDLQFIWSDEETNDAELQNKLDDTNLKNGSTTLDEVRTARGLDPYPGGLGKEPLIYTHSGVELLSEALEPTPAPILEPPKPIHEAGKGEPGGPGNEPTPPGSGNPPPGVPAPAGNNKGKPPKPSDGTHGTPPTDDQSNKMAKAKTATTPEPLNRKRALVTHSQAVLEATLAEAFQALAKRVADQATATKLAKAVDQGDPTAGIDFTLDTSVVGALKATLSGVAQDSASLGLEQVLPTADEAKYTSVRASAATWADQRAAELLTSDGDGGDLIMATRNLIRGTIAEALDSGQTFDQLADTLSDAYAFSPQRARVIARTETAFADMQGNLEGWKGSGVVKQKVWLISNEENVCDDCQQNADAGPIGLDDTFPSGDDMPPAHPNCDCDVAPLVADAEDD